MNIDISTIPVEYVQFAWLSPLVAVNKPDKLIISKEQSEKIFSGPSELSKWTDYRGIELVIVIEK